MWREGNEEHEVSGEQLTLALEHAWARTNGGMGDWKYCLADLDNAVDRIKGIERLLGAFACLETAEVSLPPEAFVALEGAVEHARIIVEAVFIRQHSPEYRVKITAPARAA
jgi:hypothetical protein